MTDFNENTPFNEEEKEKKNENVTKKKFDPKNYLNVKLEENEDRREVRIRIIPAQAGSNKIATDIHIHSLKVDPQIAKSGFKTFTCLNDKHLEGQHGCPFCEMFDEYAKEAKKLKDKDGNITNKEEWKSLWKQAFKFQPKIAHIIRVIDRDHEDEGVKFWRFNEWDNGKGSYDELKRIYKQYNENAAIEKYENEFKKTPSKEELEKYMKTDDGKLISFYDVFNLKDGHDIILTLTKGENTKDRTEVSIAADLRAKPLSLNEEQVEKWINDEKTWQDAYAVKNYDYLKVVLDGGIPVFDRTLGKYVSKEEKENNDKQAEAEAVNEINKAIKDAVETEPTDDLPF